MGIGTKIIFALGITSILLTWFALFLLPDKDQDSEPLPTTAEEFSTDPDPRPPQQSIVLLDGSTASADKIINHRDSQDLSGDGFYLNTSDEQQYAIYYDEPSGSISVSLRTEPLSLSRSLAEQQLRSIFDLDNESLCEFDIQVYVNRNVNAQYAIGDLGLSFCPNSTVLP